jgi:hypothetical protein
MAVEGAGSVTTEALGLLDALASPAGERLLARIAEALGGDGAAPDATLRLAERLRAETPPALVAAALTLHGLRMAARAKFRLAERMWFTREGLEQASSEAMALHHAARFAPAGRLADLCSGIGGDLTALAAGRQILAVDLDPVALEMAGRNAAVYGSPGVRLRRADVTRTDLAGLDGAFVDPARRVDGRRLRAGTSLPPLPWCLGLPATVPAVGVKAAPGLPLDLVPPGWEVEFTSQDGALKEALLWSPALATAPRRATLLPCGSTLVAEPGATVPAGPVGTWLLDPDPAVGRAGLVQELARGLDARRIDERIAFLTADHPLRTPFGRLYRVEEALPWQLKRLREALRARGVGTVDVRKRGSAVDVDDLRRRLRLRGDEHLTIVLTRVADRPTALLCTPAS